MRVCVCVCVCACVRVCVGERKGENGIVRARACMFMCACMGACVCVWVFVFVESVDVQSIACGVAFNQILQSQSNWSLFNKTWQKRPTELKHRLRFEIEDMILDMQ